jgi:hypothetical protein
MYSLRSKSTPIHPWHWVGVLLFILLGDYLTGPFIHSAVLFYLIPVGLASWSSRSRLPGLAVAVLWPFLRLAILSLWGWPWPTRLTIEDTVVDVILSTGFALLVWQMRKQVLAIRTLEGLLPMCGFCQRIRTPDGWERVDSYITGHSEALISHTFCPECGRLHYGHLSEEPPASQGPPAAP